MLVLCQVNRSLPRLFNSSRLWKAHFSILLKAPRNANIPFDPVRVIFDELDTNVKKSEILPLDDAISLALTQNMELILSKF